MRTTVVFLLCAWAVSAGPAQPPNQLRGRQFQPQANLQTDNRSPGSGPELGASYNDGRLVGGAQRYVHSTPVRNFMNQNNNHVPPEAPLPAPPFPAGLDKNLMEEHSVKALPPHQPPALPQHTLPCCYKMSTTVSDFVADNNNLPRKGASALHGVVTPELTAEGKAKVDQGIMTSSTLIEEGACRVCNEKEQQKDREMRFKQHNMFKHSKHSKHSKH